MERRGGRVVDEGRVKGRRHVRQRCSQVKVAPSEFHSREKREDS